MEAEQGRERVYSRQQGDGVEMPKAIGDLMLPAAPNAGHGTEWLMSALLRFGLASV